jgi:hypothetical protein
VSHLQGGRGPNLQMLVQKGVEIVAPHKSSGSAPPNPALFPYIMCSSSPHCARHGHFQTPTSCALGPHWPVPDSSCALSYSTPLQTCPPPNLKISSGEISLPIPAAPSSPYAILGTLGVTTIIPCTCRKWHPIQDLNDDPDRGSLLYMST